jgi:5,5'-dehydrodivanillate O-demethylase
VEELGGLIFAYLGPPPAPLLPRYDVLVAENGSRVVGATQEHCNWLQRAENTADQTHLTVLHGTVYPDYAMKRPTVDWQRTWYGLRSYFDVPGIKTPKIEHFIAPSHSRFTAARVGDKPAHHMNFRVPTNDTLTTTYRVTFYPFQNGKSVMPFRLKTEGLEESTAGVYQRLNDNWWGIASRDQDRMAMEQQGPIVDRSLEHLSAGDRGVILLRNIISESIETVCRGGDPIGLIRNAN